MMIKEFVFGILRFSYGYDEVEFFDDSVVFNTPVGIKYGYIQNVPANKEDFLYNIDTFTNDELIFQYSSSYIRVFKASKLKTELLKYKDSIEKLSNGYMSCPYLVVRNFIHEIKIEKNE